MILEKQEFIRRYTVLLHAYVLSPDEKYLADIEYLGQEMVLADMPPEEVGEMHDLAIASLIEQNSMNAKKIRVLSLPLMQLLMAYGVAFRSLLAKKQVEARLHLASSAIATTMEGIVITDDKGVILDVNKAFESVTGYSKAEALGNNPSMLHSGKQGDDFYRQMWGTITKSGQWQGEIWNKRKNGEIYPEHLSVSAIHNQQGELTNYIGVFSDISEQLSMEKQLRQAQKMEAIGTLVGGIAHDFNNMLAGMTGNLYLAKKRVQALPDVIEKLENVEMLSMRAADMIQQLLTFARKGMVSMKAMPLTPFIKETLKFLHISVPENIAMREDICNHALQITGDTTQIHQLLMNLVNNARDAVEGVDEPVITVRLQPFYPDDVFLEKHAYFKVCSYAHLSVKDNGCGIPAKQMDNLFEPFFTTKEQGKGTGLGLSMVYGSVKTHHGFVDINSKEGKGSTVHIYIPLLAPEDIANTAAQKPESVQGKGELILLADDEQLVREVVAEVLESMGYKVLQASDGLEAMELFKAHQHEIALALLDVVMPRCGGMPLAKQIRQTTLDVPIIFLTGYDKEHVLHDDDMISNSLMLTKPVDFDLLSYNIRQMLD